MKYLFLILISALIVSTFNSCSKNPEVNKALIGQWKYIYSIGGFSGSDTIKPSPDSIETLRINNDFTYSTYTNNQLRAQGKYYFTTSQNYSIIHFKTVIPGGSYTGYEKEIIEISSDTLHLADDNRSEGYDDFYKKIR